MSLLAWLQIQFWHNGPLLLVVLVFGMLIVQPMRKRRLRQREAKAADAEQHGMAYQPPTGSGGGGSIDQGRHHYSGVSDGISWTVETLLLAERGTRSNAPSARLAAGTYSRWTTAAESGGRGYLLLMNLPDGVKEPAVSPKRFGALIDKMATMALVAYVCAYFGEQRTEGLALSPAHRRTLDDVSLDQLYTVFCDTPERLVRLNSGTRALLREVHDLKLAVLWDGAGLAVSCPSPRVTAEDVTQLAALGVRLALLRG